MKKEQKFAPIITVVLYLGKEKIWDGAKSLHELLDMDEEIKPFVNNFKLNLFDYHDYEDFDRFKTENRLLFEMLACEKDKKKMKEVLEKHTIDGKVDEESAKAILGMLKVKIDLDKIMKKNEKGEEVYDMCQAFEDYKEEGRLSGIEEGRHEGEISAFRHSVEKVMKKMQMSFEEAADFLELPKAEQKKLQVLM